MKRRNVFQLSPCCSVFCKTVIPPFLLFPHLFRCIQALLIRSKMIFILCHFTCHDILYMHLHILFHFFFKEKVFFLLLFLTVCIPVLTIYILSLYSDLSPVQIWWYKRCEWEGEMVFNLRHVARYRCVLRHDPGRYGIHVDQLWRTEGALHTPIQRYQGFTCKKTCVDS